jgi:hypothetical protein
MTMTELIFVDPPMIAMSISDTPQPPSKQADSAKKTIL